MYQPIHILSDWINTNLGHYVYNVCCTQPNRQVSNGCSPCVSGSVCQRCDFMRDNFCQYSIKRNANSPWLIHLPWTVWGYDLMANWFVPRRGNFLTCLIKKSIFKRVLRPMHRCKIGGSIDSSIKIPIPPPCVHPYHSCMSCLSVLE